MGTGKIVILKNLSNFAIKSTSANYSNPFFASLYYKYNWKYKFKNFFMHLQCKIS